MLDIFLFSSVIHIHFIRNTIIIILTNIVLGNIIIKCRIINRA